MANHRLLSGLTSLQRSQQDKVGRDSMGTLQGTIVRLILVRTHMIRGRTAISDAKPRNTVHIISIISPQWPIL